MTTPTLREAAQAALPVLELVAQYRSYNGDTWPAEQVAPIVAALRAALAQPVPDARPCTCHPADNPPQPCAKRYALSECRAAAHPQQPAPLDCRTCRNHTTASGGCISVLRCIDGSAYQRAGVRQCWESGIVPAPTTESQPQR